MASTPIGTLLNENHITQRKLFDLLTDAGFKTSIPMISRFVNQTLRIEYMREFSIAVAGVLAPYLLEHTAMTATEIDRTLQEIFNEGEYQPMISKRIALSDDACRYFGFLTDIDGKRDQPLDPFKLPPESRDQVYFPPEYREIYDRVLDAIKYRHFVAVLGKIGSGKTTLRAMVEDQIARETNLLVIWPEFFEQSKISAYEIARSILRETGAHAPGRASALGKAVTNKLQTLTQNGNRVAIGFDECHKMAKGTVRSLKNFHEMSSGGFQKYLGIILFGWLSFAKTIEDEEFQEIYERLEIYYMPTFQGKLAAGYLNHRMALIGKTTSDLFDDDAVELLAANAETPLQMGNLTNKALQHTMGDGEKRATGDALRRKMFFDTPREGKGGFRAR